MSLEVANLMNHAKLAILHWEEKWENKMMELEQAKLKNAAEAIEGQGVKKILKDK